MTVVGTTFYSAGQPRRKGTVFPTTIAREPHNTHDRNALAVQYEGQTVGHIPATLAAKLSPVLDQEGVPRIQSRVGCDGGNKLSVAMIYTPNRLRDEIRGRG
ncbi:HIRAN domain-containing protein [Scrofimicrobium sp. R131]|uniref:HIRAN domain-containing protein n=1 Tax=Scrofimicrobium appendicitidis TaxID=3079930 RepID=UPI003305E59D